MYIILDIMICNSTPVSSLRVWRVESNPYRATVKDGRHSGKRETVSQICGRPFLLWKSLPQRYGITAHSPILRHVKPPHGDIQSGLQ